MRLGFLTACLPSLSLDQIAQWASQQGFQALEVAVWPRTDDRPFVASHIDVTSLDEKSARQWSTRMADLGLWLNYDPSHLPGLGIDPVTALRPYVDRVAHVQAKDVETFPDKRDRYGFFGKTWERQGAWERSWWRFRVPGLGEVDWRRVIDVLYEGGFDGTVSIEHEDPTWGGTEDKIKTGLTIAQRILQPLLVK